MLLHSGCAPGSPEAAAPATPAVPQAPAGSAPRPSFHRSKPASTQSEPDHPAGPPLALSQAAAARCTGTAAVPRHPSGVARAHRRDGYRVGSESFPVPRPDDHPRMHRVPVAARAQRWKPERPAPEHLHPLRPTPPTHRRSTRHRRRLNHQQSVFFSALTPAIARAAKPLLRQPRLRPVCNPNHQALYIRCGPPP